MRQGEALAGRLVLLVVNLCWSSMSQHSIDNLSSPSTAADASQQKPWLIIGVASAGTFILLATLAWALLSPANATPSPPQSSPVTPPAEPQPTPPPVVADKKTDKKPDKQRDEKVGKKGQAKPSKPADIVKALKKGSTARDTKDLWRSPTDGAPLNLGYLSPGAQLIAILRPAALLEHPDADKIRAALGPAGQRGIEAIEQATIARLGSIDQLIIGGQVTSAGNWLVTYVVHTKKEIPRDALVARLTNPQEKTEGGQTYWLSKNRAYYLPPNGKGKVLVVAPLDAIADIIDLAGNPPPLRRDIERLLDHTDTDRQATIIVAPNSLFSEGQSLFAGELERLSAPLFWFLGDELSGAALSMHWGDDFFLELIATPKLETTPEKASRIFAERCSQIPDKLQQYIASLAPDAYGREIGTHVPSMLRKRAEYTRSGFEPDHAVLRCYLPIAAGHNLLMAADLTLAESPGTATRIASADEAPSGNSTASATSAAGVRDRLAKVTSLRFSKDTLEAALEQLSQDIGVAIVIRGSDLQADGITKNQSFGIDISNKSAEQVLIEILRLANPDKEATGPTDPRQKLVYLVEQGSDKTEQIVVTTRGRAKERRKELPAAFRPAKP